MTALAQVRSDFLMPKADRSALKRQVTAEYRQQSPFLVS